ncbi:DUF1045 domain-containing protein [Roseovarius salis]|uniref:DUF1045 domain-containing protein n=1 Tax=Roseovarius salis TaxID=3376063 RepID=UPI0037C68886
MTFQRYAVYYTAPDGPLARFGADWLGWDIAAGCAVLRSEPGGLPVPLDEITQAPAKYGFHATIKPPFRLAHGQTRDALAAAFGALCDGLAPVRLDGLELARLGAFLALRPRGETAPLDRLAADVVRTLDRFRAAPTEADLTRRRAAGLTPRQDELLAQWGYPYVMEEFRFHMTLTGRLPRAHRAQVRTVLERDLAPLLPAPFVLDALSLVGEATDGRFHLLHRHALASC